MNQLLARFSNVEGMNAKSNVLVSLLWLFFLTLCSTITYGIWGNKELVLYCLLVMLIIEILVIFGVYIYFAITNPDCLRSETFTLNKLALEKGLIGDDTFGLTDSSNERKYISGTEEVNDGSNE